MCEDWCIGFGWLSVIKKVSQDMDVQETSYYKLIVSIKLIIKFLVIYQL